MVMKLFALVVLAVLVAPSHQWFEQCTIPVAVQPKVPVTIANFGFPAPFGPKSSCQWNIQAPRNFRVLAECTLNLAGPVPSCYTTAITQRWLVNTDGNPNLTAATYYCGQQTMTSISKSNLLAVGYFATAGTGTVSCKLSAIQ